MFKLAGEPQNKSPGDWLSSSAFTLLKKHFSNVYLTELTEKINLANEIINSHHTACGVYVNDVIAQNYAQWLSSN